MPRRADFTGSAGDDRCLSRRPSRLPQGVELGAEGRRDRRSASLGGLSARPEPSGDCGLCSPGSAGALDRAKKRTCMRQKVAPVPVALYKRNRALWRPSWPTRSSCGGWSNSSPTPARAASIPPPKFPRSPARFLHEPGVEDRRSVAPRAPSSPLRRQHGRDGRRARARRRRAAPDGVEYDPLWRNRSRSARSGRQATGSMSQPRARARAGVGGVEV